MSAMVPMTNANLPERWLNDMRFRRKRLSDSAFRSYMCALMWSVANRSEGVIERGDLEDIPDFNPADIGELMRGELWESRGPDCGWLIHDFDTTQTGKDLLEKQERERAYDRKRKAQARAAALAAKLAGQNESAGKSTGQSPPESPRTEQNKPGHYRGANPDSPIDDDYAADYREWCAEDEREHLEQLADRNVRGGYDR